MPDRDVAAGICASGGVVQPAGTVCRAAAGPCDFEETCDGVTADCPADELAAAGTVLPRRRGRLRYCGNLLRNQRRLPADVFKQAGTVCRPAAGVCDVEKAAREPARPARSTPLPRRPPCAGPRPMATIATRPKTVPDRSRAARATSSTLRLRCPVVRRLPQERIGYRFLERGGRAPLATTSSAARRAAAATPRLAARQPRGVAVSRQRHRRGHLLLRGLLHQHHRHL